MGKEVRELIEEYANDIKRDGFADLFAYLEEIGFFVAPASGGNHCCTVGGLAEHSLNVVITAESLAKTLFSPKTYDMMLESVIIAALLHDVGKLGDYDKKMYVENVLKSGKTSDSKPYKRNPNLLPIDHATRSLCIINRFMDLTEDEEFAIRYHDGLYERANYALTGNETPLYIIIHTADLWASHIVERG